MFPLKKDTKFCPLYPTFQNLVPKPHLATREDVKYSHNPRSLLKMWGSVKKEGGQNGHWGTTIGFCPRIVASPFAFRYKYRSLWIFHFTLCGNFWIRGCAHLYFHEYYQLPSIDKVTIHTCTDIIWECLFPHTLNSPECAHTFFYFVCLFLYHYHS